MSDNIKFQIIENEENLFKLDSSNKTSNIQFNNQYTNIPKSSNMTESDKMINQLRDQFKNSSQMPTHQIPTLQQTNSINSPNSFEQQVRNYVEKNKIKLYILTPCFASLCYVNYVHCLMNTVEVFRRLNIPLKIEFCKNDSLVSRARNNLIARAMTDKDATHFMFIDNDISWDPVDILKLILAEKDLIGGIYPLKNYDWDRLVKDPLNPYNTNVIQALLKKKNESQLANMVSDSSMIQHNLLRYNINYLGQYLEITNNIAKVKHLATGFMMIRRKLLTSMMQAFPSTKYVDDVNFLRPEENAMAYALFDCGVEEGHYFSEDWLFCDRWTKMGGDIYIDVSINLTHTGIEDYRGCYISTIL